MKPGVYAGQVRCKACGKKFLRSSTYDQGECPGCRRGQPRRAFMVPQGRKKRTKRTPVLPERFWTDWLIRQLQPFLGREAVSVNEIILHLREQAAKTRAA